MSTWIKSTVVVVGAILFTTLAINASDVFRGLEGNLLGLAIDSTGPCGTGSVLMQLSSGALCVDIYEASPGQVCDVSNPKNEVDTQVNIKNDACIAVSKQGVSPWRFVSMTQAQQLCARAGKRLFTNEEWYQTVLGLTEIEKCVIDTDGSPEETGVSSCVTPAGVHDMVGNVWEWVTGEVSNGEYKGLTLPTSGYVSLVSSEGMVLETSNTPQTDYGDDYAWIDDSGVRGMLRGGFYGSGTDAGVFTLNASVPLNFKTNGVGFRCVKDLY